jgi:hypothetical protein
MPGTVSLAGWCARVREHIEVEREELLSAQEQDAWKPARGEWSLSSRGESSKEGLDESPSEHPTGRGAR